MARKEQPMSMTRSAGVAIAVVSLALLVAACGGSSSSSGSPGLGGSTSSPSAVGYSACMRAHGVPSFPDPDSSRHLPKGDAQRFGVSSAQLEAAQRACQRMLPDTGGSFRQETDDCFTAGACPRVLVQRILNVQRNYSRCMRSHGFPNWPDPTTDSRGRPYFDIGKAGISEDDTRSSRWTLADRECEHLVGIDGDVPVDLG
jgi:hypothetical protein